MGAIAVESLMRARRVVVGEVPAQQASEMPFVEDDDVIEAFPSNRSNHALGIGVLPGRAWGDEDLVDPHALHPPREHVAVDGVAITEQVLGRGLFREGLDKLLGGPSGGRVVGHIDVDEFPASVPKDNEPEEKAERQGREYEEVDGRDLMSVHNKLIWPSRG